ncbi:MAG: hypothetical protein J1F11_00110 [Oscillospiraceae bacterium]|nr:hypothetical protein [Oscillospiraceae bacterium]
MRKFLYGRILTALTASVIFFTSCNKEAPLPHNEEIIATETTSETISETVSESPITEAQTTEPETVTEPKKYEPYQLKLYDSSGTGMPRPDNYERNSISYHLGGDLDEIFSLMKDKSVSEKIQNEVNEWINYIEEKYNTDGEKEFRTYCYARNGILFYKKYSYNPYEKYTIVFDLKTGKRLELSDMFFEGEKFIDKLNKELWNNIQKLDFVDYYSFDVDYPQIKREFTGLTEDGFYFDDSGFYFPVDNPYFTTFKEFNVSILNFDSILNVSYDMTGLFEDGADKQLRFSVLNYGYETNYYIQTGNINVYLFDETSMLTEEQREFLNNKALSLTSSEFLDRMREKYGWNVYSADEPPVYSRIYENPDGTEEKWIDFFTIKITVRKNNIAEIRFRQDNVYEAPNQSYNLHYDLETLEPLDIEDIFARTFGDKEYVWRYINVWGEEIDGFKDSDVPDLSKLTLENLSVYDTEIYFDGITDDRVIWGSISQKKFD